MSQASSEITVELYGIARQRARTAQLQVTLPATESLPPTLGQLLTRLSQLQPDLEGECIRGDQLGSACAANLDGKQFVRDPATPIPVGVTVMLLSADAGG